MSKEKGTLLEENSQKRSFSFILVLTLKNVQTSVNILLHGGKLQKI